MLNSMQKKTASKLNRLNATYSDVETILARVTNSLDAINLKLADLDAKQKYIADAEDRIRQEMTRLADGFGEQSQVSKAIELARDGASASEIMQIRTCWPCHLAEASGACLFNHRAWLSWRILALLDLPSRSVQELPCISKDLQTCIETTRNITKSMEPLSATAVEQILCDVFMIP